MPRLPVHLASAVLTCLSLGSAALGQDDLIGADAYRESCAVCHGPSGLGDGEFANVLTVRPPNLTLLSSKNNGEFPFLLVFQTIDGRAIVPAHGTRVMPIWGDSFEPEAEAVAGPYGAELLVRARIVALVDYIETLQK